MKQKKIKITQPDDETLIIKFGKIHFRYTHDDHGWQGMSDAECLAKAIALAFDIPVEYK